MMWFTTPTADFWIRLGVALVCGALIGVERQLRGKPAGIRTSMLICAATQAFVAEGATLGPDSDPTRVLGQVVTGVGFLGAGVILARGERLLGVTSAAVIWMLAAIGATVGLGHAVEALVLSLVTVGLLVGVRWLEQRFHLSLGQSDEADG